jgi:hypothetical protein
MLGSRRIFYLQDEIHRSILNDTHPDLKRLLFFTFFCSGAPDGIANKQALEMGVEAFGMLDVGNIADLNELLNEEVSQDPEWFKKAAEECGDLLKRECAEVAKFKKSYRQYAEDQLLEEFDNRSSLKS